MRRFLSLLLALICVLSLYACGDESNGDTTSTEDGALVPITRDDGTVLAYERYYHDDNGNLKRLDSYDANEVYDHYMLYDYDANGRLIQETRYKADGLGDYYYAYTYDDDGNLIEMGYYTMHDGATRTLYDADGQEIERYAYDDEDKLTSHEVKVDGIWVAATEPDEAETETADNE